MRFVRNSYCKNAEWMNGQTASLIRFKNDSLVLQGQNQTRQELLGDGFKFCRLCVSLCYTQVPILK